MRELAVGPPELLKPNDLLSKLMKTFSLLECKGPFSEPLSCLLLNCSRRGVKDQRPSRTIKAEPVEC